MGIVGMRNIYLPLFALTALGACSQTDDVSLAAVSRPERATETAETILEAAITAHGGYEKLKAAATWEAEIRRHQRGDSYVMTNYYRPGMVRLEQDLRSGRRSADVIGHPHCWGMRGEVSVPCSDETRENDRPRVVMEMALQLWPLKERDWELRSATKSEEAGKTYDVLMAYYRPQETLAEFHFDTASHLLHSISAKGIKGGVSGSHRHVYSDYSERCDVQMPSHNVKSFEGAVWVTEDVLQLECVPVDESLFLRPPLIADGHMATGYSNPTALGCIDIAVAENAGADARETLVSRLAAQKIEPLGNPVEIWFEDGTTELCSRVEESTGSSHGGLSIRKVAEGASLSAYFLGEVTERRNEIVERLLGEAAGRDFSVSWPVRIERIDNDGMGMTGELVIEASVPIGRR